MCFNTIGITCVQRAFVRSRNRWQVCCSLRHGTRSAEGWIFVFGEHRHKRFWSASQNIRSVVGSMNEPVILCVDDQEIVLSSLKRELMSAFGAEYLIETAEDGDDALELFADLLAEGYDIPLVISDQIMPGLKGHEFLQRLHERAPDTLKIMLTGQADMDAVINAVNSANLYRYIAKPWEHTDLVLTVKEAVEKYFQDRRVVQQHLELQQLYLQAQAELAERKRMTAMLHEREARIRAILNTAGDGILTINQGGLIQSCNPAAERIFGYSATEISGRPIYHLIPQLDGQP